MVDPEICVPVESTARRQRRSGAKARQKAEGFCGEELAVGFLMFLRQKMGPKWGGGIICNRNLMVILRDVPTNKNA